MATIESRSNPLASPTIWLLVGLVGAWSCAGSQAQGERDEPSGGGSPGWLRSGDHAEYASDAYLTGVGSGRSRREAYASALSEIVFQVKSDIEVSYGTETVERVEAGNQRETEIERERTSVQDIQLKSNFEAADLVDLAEVHRDEKGQYHAFAVLELMEARRHAQRQYREVVDSHASFAEQSAGRLEQMPIREVAGVVSRLQGAVTELEKAEIMIHSFGGQVPSSSPITDVLKRAQKRLFELRRRITVQICLETDGAPEEARAGPYLRRKIAEWFSERSVDTAECREESSSEQDVERHVMRLDVETEHACDQADEIEAITMCRTFGDLTLRRIDGSGSIASRPIGGEGTREGHRNPEQALRNSMDHVIGEIGEGLTEVFGP